MMVVVTPAEVMLRVLRPRFDVPVLVEVPAERPDFFIRVQVSDTKPLNLALEQSLVFVQVYGLDVERVIVVSAEVQRLLHNADMLDDVFMGWHQLGSPCEYSDPDVSELYRWQQSGELLTSISW